MKTLGNYGYVPYFDGGEYFTGLNICQNLSDYIFNMLSLHLSVILNKALRNRQKIKPNFPNRFNYLIPEKKKKGDTETEPIVCWGDDAIKKVRKDSYIVVVLFFS